MSKALKRGAGFLGLTLMTFVAFADQTDNAWVDPISQMKFVQIPAGCFAMGNPNALLEDRSDFPLVQLGFIHRPYVDEGPVHEVCTSRFWVAETEVTADQWRQVTGRLPPYGQGRVAAGGIDWQMAQSFIAAMNRQSDGVQFRLPTEAEWERVCRLGYPEGPPKRRQDYQSVAWYNLKGRRPEAAQPVAELAVSAVGTYDLLGNVWEWTADTYHPETYIDNPRQDPLHTADTDRRVIRGGSYRSLWQEVRCWNRGAYGEAMPALEQIGLRLVRDD